MNRSQKNRKVKEMDMSFKSPAGIKNRVLGAQERINKRYRMILEKSKELTDEKLAEVIKFRKWDGKTCSSTDIAALMNENDRREKAKLAPEVPHTSIDQP